ncbi:MAG TPA: lipid A biosynthesis lauroyl acyltransferase [Xanthobacteraceae bacterium]
MTPRARSGWRWEFFLWRKRTRTRLAPYLAPFRRVTDYVVAGLTRMIVRTLARLDPDASSDFAGTWARWIGPWLPPSRIGRANLRLAFPEKSAAEREEILKGCWENLGRVAGEFVHLDKLWEYDDARPNAGRIETFNVSRFIGLYTDNKPALIFSAHLANWELAAIAGRKYGLDSAVLFRPPSNPFIAELIHETRADMMSQLVPTGSAAGMFMGAVLERGGHLAMLVDQHRKPGTRVNFFGRPCWANVTVARLARQYDCPVHGARVIRLPKNRFRVELTRALALPRDAEGMIDINGAMQTITSVIEGWIREYPDQWLWLHRRWRD